MALLLVTSSVMKGMHNDSGEETTFSEATHQQTKEALERAKNADREIGKLPPIHPRASTLAYNPRWGLPIYIYI